MPDEDFDSKLGQTISGEVGKPPESTDDTEETGSTEEVDSTEETQETGSTEGTESTDNTGSTEGTDSSESTESTEKTDSSEGEGDTDSSDSTGSTNSSESTSNTDNTEGTDNSDSTGGTGSTRSRDPYPMYLTDDLHDDLNDRFEKFNARRRLDDLETVEKHRHFMEGLIRAGLDHDELEEFVLDEADLTE